MVNQIGLYIHIPFCQQKCHYCDFLTFARQDDTIEDYVEYLIKELALYREQDYHLDTLYFGGGTPSHLEGDSFAQIMAAIADNFQIDSDCEITIEMNPESVTKDKVITYLEQGVNRFSMGVQSFNPQVLKMMGRLHTAELVFDKVALLKELGCQNLSLDLMFANPKQTMEIIQDDLDQVLSMDIQHLSIYSLMIKDNTPFQRWVQTGQIHLVDDDIERDMYHYIQAKMVEAGFHQYEISNFAREGRECRHNLKYWTLQNYLGVGLGAASNLDLVRYTHCRTFKQYFAMIDQGKRPIQYSEQLTMEDREKEYIMLTMRLLKGFNIEELNHKFQIDFLAKYGQAVEKHLKNGVIQIEDQHLSFTDFGLDVGNQFYLDIL